MDGSYVISAVETDLLNRLTTNQWSVVPFLFWFGYAKIGAGNFLLVCMVIVSTYDHCVQVIHCQIKEIDMGCCGQIIWDEGKFPAK